jgi:hypothetical protein
VRTVQDILDKKLGWTEFTLELAKVNRFRRFVFCGRIYIKLQFRVIDGVKDAPSGCRIVGIEQVNVQLRQLLLGRIRFVRNEDFVMCQGLLLNTPARTLDDTKCVRSFALVA